MNSNNCITDENLLQFRGREYPAEERGTLELHLAECAKCRTRMAENFFATSEPEYFDIPGDLKQKAHALAEKDSPEATSTGPRRFFTFPGRYLQFAAGAVILICLGLTGVYFLNRTPAPETDTYRQGSSTSGSLKLLSPLDGAEILADKVEFRWTAVANTKSYMVVVLNARGDVVARQNATGDAFSLDPASAGLVNGEQYFWYVKARLADGTVIDSDTAKFRIVK